MADVAIAGQLHSPFIYISDTIFTVNFEIILEVFIGLIAFL